MKDEIKARCEKTGGLALWLLPFAIILGIWVGEWRPMWTDIVVLAAMVFACA